MSRPLRVLAFLGALALIAAVMAVLAMGSGSRAALRQYVAELQAKGEKLTFEELTCDRLTNSPDTHAVIRGAARALERAGSSPSSLELRTYVGPGQAAVTWRQARPVWGKANGPPDTRGWAELEAQMKAAQKTLQRLRAALKDPAADAGPPTNMIFTRFGTRRLIRDEVRTAEVWLMGAMESDLHQGRLEDALQSLEALAGLARLGRDEPAWVDQVSRVSFANLGLAATWEALQAPGWTEPQLQRLQQAWAPVDLVDAVEKAFVGQRAGGYEMFAFTRRYGGAALDRLLAPNAVPASLKGRLLEFLGNYVIMPAYKLTSIDRDELFYLRNMQEAITALRLLKAHRPWAEAKPRLDQVATNFHALADSTRRLRYILSTMVRPYYGRAGENAVHAETERQMALAAIALKRFQLRHGSLPPNLEALVPEFLPTVPHDYLSAKPLGYRLQADGSYVLYSVGDDGKDDGGDPTPLAGNFNVLWTSRDAVWPSAAGP